MTSQTLSRRPADVFMRRLLRVDSVDPNAILGARRLFSRSIVIAGIRCAITYLLVPIAVPVMGIAGTVATPISLALCLFAMVNGVISVRRFWQANHKSRWAYTYFMAAVFVFLLVAIVMDLRRLFL